VIRRWFEKRRKARELKWALSFASFVSTQEREEIWIFPDDVPRRWQPALDRGWVDRVRGYVRQHNRDAAPYQLTDAGREALATASRSAT
jgi:hypothetical protein